MPKAEGHTRSILRMQGWESETGILRRWGNATDGMARGGETALVDWGCGVV